MGRTQLTITLLGVTAALLAPAPCASARPPLKPPTNLVATGADQQVALTWTASLSHRTTGYTDSGLTNGTTYTYRVTAIDAESPPWESDPSNTASATPSASVPVGTLGPCGTAVSPP